MKIATVICNYNYQDYVIDSIKSAINQQTSIDHSVVYVDDGSTDKSWDLVAKEFPPKSATMKMVGGKLLNIWQSGNLFYTRIENSGASVARNMGIEIAGQQDAIHILDSDDSIFIDKIEIFQKKLFEYDEIGVVYADYIIKRPEYSKIELKESYSAGKLNSRCIVHSGSMIKTKYLSMISPEHVYNPKLHGPAGKNFIGCTEDYELWLRLSRVCMFSHIPKVLTIVNEHGGNQSMKMTPEIFQNNLNKFYV